MAIACLVSLISFYDLFWQLPFTILSEKCIQWACQGNPNPISFHFNFKTISFLCKESLELWLLSERIRGLIENCD